MAHTLYAGCVFIWVYISLTLDTLLQQALIHEPVFTKKSIQLTFHITDAQYIGRGVTILQILDLITFLYSKVMVRFVSVFFLKHRLPLFE